MSAANSTAPPMLPPEAAAAIAALTQAGQHLRIEDSFAICAVCFLLYDHLLTIGDEVEYIWKRKMTPVSIIYLLTRYFADIALVIVLDAILAPDWSIEKCNNFARFEGATTQIIVLLAEIVLILRVFAVHDRSKVVLFFMAFVWLAQASMMTWTLSNSGPVVIPPSPVTRGCVLVANPSIGNKDLMFVIPSAVFDCMTFILLSIGIIRKARATQTVSSLGSLILKDGILYFMVIFSTNTAWSITGAILPTDLKNILALPATAVTATFISRLTLNLKMHRDYTVTSSNSNFRTETTSWFRHQLGAFVAAGGNELADHDRKGSSFGGGLSGTTMNSPYPYNGSYPSSAKENNFELKHFKEQQQPRSTLHMA